MVKQGILFVLLLFPLSSYAATFERTQIMMGNVPVTLTIKASSSKKLKAFQAMEGAFAEAKSLGEKVSEWNPKSDTSRLNRGGQKKVSINPDLMQLLLTARQVSEQTDGTFDVTFASRNRKASFQDLVLFPEMGFARFEKPSMKIGVSSIAKGMIVDRMSLVLKKYGFKNHLVNAGDIYASGKWKVFVKNPDDPTGKPLKSIWVKNKAVSTSGNYERGRHILNPKTRKPATYFKSVTVITDRSTLASPLATGIFASEKTPEKIPNIEISVVVD